MQNPGGTKGGVSNPGVVVSELVETNLQGMIYYINHFSSFEEQKYAMNDFRGEVISNETIGYSINFPLMN